MIEPGSYLRPSKETVDRAIGLPMNPLRPIGPIVWPVSRSIISYCCAVASPAHASMPSTIVNQSFPGIDPAPKSFDQSAAPRGESFGPDGSSLRCFACEAPAPRIDLGRDCASDNVSKDCEGVRHAGRKPRQ